MPDGAIHYKFDLLKLTMAVDNFVPMIIRNILMFGHQPLVVYLCVSECICTSMSGTILPTICQRLVCRVEYCQQGVKCLVAIQ